MPATKVKRTLATLDANEAVARVAYRLNEVIAIYPITPSSIMSEWADQWSSEGVPNIWGSVPTVVEMQSEAGAAGAVHGALQTGSLATTFTASQGLMLMLPNMYKIAGELTPAVIHVASRALAAQGLSIFGDHSDVMAARSTGFAMLNSASVQEAHDFALIAQAATLESRIPFIHFFDGFRTSHEVDKIELLDDSDLRKMIIEDDIYNQGVIAHRVRALSPDNPFIRGTAQNPDTYFQGRETVNSFYLNCSGAVQNAMDKFAGLTGRQYKLYEYHGAPDARRVIVIMGSGAEAVHETVDYLNAHAENKDKGRVGVLKVRLYRPFDAKQFMQALPPTVQAVAVMDRTKEPGSLGEPLYLDSLGAIHECMSSGWGYLTSYPAIVGGRYGLSSKEFTPAMVKAIFDNLALPQPKNHFTVGINDDVTHTSLEYDPDFVIEADNVFRGVFYGLGSDGTVGANKSSIKIIGEETDNYAQGYFVYDSKKSGAMTVSHLRFGPDPIHSTYLIQRPNFVACHQPVFLDRYDMLKNITPGGVFLLNTYYWPNEVWNRLPPKVQRQIAEKHLSFYVIDANKVARDSGMRQINTVMQACFFAISGVLPRDEAMAAIEHSIRKTYGKKGEEVVRKNLEAVSRTLEHLHKVEVPDVDFRTLDGHVRLSAQEAVLNNQAAPPFVREVLGKMIIGEGASLPVSALPVDGTYPSGTSQYEKRNLANEIPVWDQNICIQCGKCTMVCPHGVLRIKVYDEAELKDAPPTFKHVGARDREWQGLAYTIQVSPEDCTACGLCVDVCPVKNKSEARLKALNLQPQAALREQESENWEFFLDLPEMDRLRIKENTIRQQQVQQPLFEFSGACSGCGETPYVKLLTQLFGDRLVVANATGCSSIYGGNLPTTPWTHNSEGRGPAWANSLFEDNAEFGLGFRVSLDKQRDFACELLKRLAPQIDEDLVASILAADQHDEAGIQAQRERVAELKVQLTRMLDVSQSDGIPCSSDARQLLQLADMLVRKSVWILGGDGWAYDIGFGGLDHVLASGRNVKVLVMDTEVYSNTGGQASKSTPKGAVAKFAAGGKPGRKKDLGLMAMTYGNIYVASVAMGAKDEHTLKAFLEAEAYDGPALIIAYSHCIEHGIDMVKGLQDQKAAVDSGQWILYRYNPDLEEQGQNPLTLDSRPATIPLEQYRDMENRFRMLYKSHPEHAQELLLEAEEDIERRRKYYEYLANRPVKQTPATDGRPLSTNGKTPTSHLVGAAPVDS